ncbi:MAG: efflux transporter outer membrane subunit [Deltaproteobacteria bacterium]|jgi:NodT family efflux transporter outer membrane factor (OMF) lipoprotein|nr:efflux transporter outer membrane subunit [Deltaproteobacteria bacterium]
MLLKLLNKTLSEKGYGGFCNLFVCSLIAAILLTTGCAMVGPDFVKPEAPVETEWMEARDPGIKTEASDYKEWWSVFNDPVLNSLVEQAYQQNLPLQISGIRILQARAQLGVLIGNVYPQQQQGRGGAQYNHLSENSPNSINIDDSFWQYDAGFDVAWEVDIWGKFRRAVESGVANLEASIASYDDVLVSLSAEVARTYVLLRTFQERLEIATENVKIQQRSMEIAEIRFKAGAVTELDVVQAKSLLRNTEAFIPRFKAAIRQAKNALAVLLGKLPGEIDHVLGGAKLIPKAPPEIVVDVPAELMRRRPDIQLAEYQIATQTPLIGVSKAELYPAFELFGSFGLLTSSSRNTKAGGRNGSGFSDLFEADSFEFFGGPSIRWNILNYGRINNQVRVEDALLQQLIVNYEDTVLRAQREVEDSMIGFLRKQQEAGFLMDSVNASQRSVDLSMLQYKEGMVDYQRVLDSQRSLTDQQDVWTATRGDAIVNLIAMYKALGGGWQIREGKDFVSKQNMEQMEKRTNWGDLLEPEALATPASAEERRQWRWPDW